MKHIYIKVTLAVIATIFVAGIGFGWFVYKKINKENGSQSNICLYVSESTTKQDVIDAIAKNCGENFAWWVNKIFEVRKRRINRYPGFYKITPQMSAYDIYNILALGDNSHTMVTFNNIRTKYELSNSICKNLNMPADSLYSAICNKDICEKYGFDTVSIVTMFLPDSYSIFCSTSVEKLLERMYKEYKLFWNSDRLNRAEKIGLTPYQITTLASIVEEETKKPDEMDIVAGLYINRLKKGMLLQSDPTVKYAIGDFGLKRILNKHLEFDSPYNTYKYAGLPPGPIRIPSKVAIDKSLNYKDTNFLYMCAKEDFSGYHNFAKTLSEHNKNAAKYRHQLNRLKIK